MSKVHTAPLSVANSFSRHPFCCNFVWNLYNASIEFEWDEAKNLSNQRKHGVDFETATGMWNDGNRVELHASHPLEDRGIMIGEIGKNLWTAIFTMRGETVRIISVRRATKRERELYDKKETS